jgi:hypothetical protein
MSAKTSRRARAEAYAEATKRDLWNLLKREMPRHGLRRLFHLPPSNAEVAKLYAYNLKHFAQDAASWLCDPKQRQAAEREQRRFHRAQRLAFLRRGVERDRKEKETKDAQS